LEKFYLTNTLVNLLRWGLRSQNAEASAFEQGDASHWADIQDARVHNWAALPLTAVMQPSTVQDHAHALGDKASWSLVNSWKLIADFERMQAPGRDLDDARFRSFQDVVDAIPFRLSKRVEGNHYFFVGRNGARDTAKAMSELVSVVDDLQKKLDLLLT
jgi:hypothetical protein